MGYRIMKAYLRLGMIVAWLVVATVLYAMIWTRYLEYFAQYPEWVGLAIEKITRPLFLLMIASL